MSTAGMKSAALKTAMAGLALLAAATAAIAADAEPVISPGPFSPPPAYPHPSREPVVTPGPFDAPPAYSRSRAYNWTGFYVGLNGGGAFGDTRWTSVPDVTSGKVDVSGGLFGGTAGYNLQTGDPFVVGVEGDFDWSGLKGTVPPLSCAPGCAIENSWLSTARLRFGYAFDAVMPYITGGAAIGDLDANILGAPFGTQRAVNVGWTAGAGIEFVVWGGLRAKIEYLHVDLNGFNCTLACGGGPISLNVSDNVFRAGLNYRIWGD